MGIYREIVEPERIVYTDTFADAAGNPVPPTHYGMSSSHPAGSLAFSSSFLPIQCRYQGGWFDVSMNPQVPSGPL